MKEKGSSCSRASTSSISSDGFLSPRPLSSGRRRARSCSESWKCSSRSCFRCAYLLSSAAEDAASKLATLAAVRSSRDAITCTCFVTSWMIQRSELGLCLQEPGLGIRWPKWREAAVHGCCGCVVHSGFTSLARKLVYYVTRVSLATLYQSWV